MIGPGNLLPPLHICQHLIAEWAADEEFVGNSVRVLLSTHQSAHYVAQTQEHDCCLWDRERGRKKETPGSLFSTCLCLQTANFFTKHVVEQNKAEKRWLISIWKYAVMLGSHLKMQLTERNTLYLFSLVLWQCWIIAALHMHVHLKECRGVGVGYMRENMKLYRGRWNVIIVH